MEKIEQERKVLKWKSEKYGLFEATLWDGELTDFRACKNGSQPTICTDDIEFLKEVRDAISDLLKEVKK